MSMNWNDFETVFSQARVGRYKSRYHGNEVQAMTAYLHNLRISESLTPFFSTVEIALRNSMHKQLGAYFGRIDWWETWAGNRAYRGQVDRIQAAYSKLLRRREPTTPDKVVAELTFGFWATLFNVEFQHTLWSPLRKAFPNCPKLQRQRKTVAALVNTLRDMRNRAFHHEPVLWLSPDVGTVYEDGLKLVSWIHGPVEAWLVNLTRVHTTWSDWKFAEASFAMRMDRISSAPVR
ncbi:hypothetical protein [Trinickia diaoshuihuensis]|uniref:hypothetical protein n=1 Tax=Trinickia diaoshuihuensis TaxID=2292265 RepID=UPI000E267136|nr:hypothetical protein [Trinickia diaoshuihuensis]